MIRDLILSETLEQAPSSPEEEIADNQPLAKPDWDHSGSEQIVQEAESTVQNSPPERSRSRDSGRSRERATPADPIPVEGP